MHYIASYHIKMCYIPYTYKTYRHIHSIDTYNHIHIDVYSTLDPADPMPLHAPWAPYIRCTPHR